MILVISGSRTLGLYQFVPNMIDRFDLNSITEVVTDGTPAGISQFAKRYANDKKLPLKIFDVNLVEHGKGATMIRNKNMVDYAIGKCGQAIVLLIWTGNAGHLKYLKNYTLIKRVPLCEALIRYPNPSFGKYAPGQKWEPVSSKLKVVSR